MINHGAVKVPSIYWKSTKNDYSDWPLAWVREALQNSSDGGAKNINIQIEEVDFPDRVEGAPVITRVTCTDDGRGMTKDVLLDVFLRMGGSLKNEGAIGGFGHAKLVLAFAHKSYEIKTGDVIVKGTGGDYTWTDGNPYVKGVVLAVEMESDGFGAGSIYSMNRAANTVITHSDFSVTGVNVTLNNDAVKSCGNNFNYDFNTGIGTIKFSDVEGDCYYSTIWVRMNGLAMFKEDVRAPNDTGFIGCLDLNGSSLDLMTSNRDGLKGEHSQTLNQALQELSNDRFKLKLSGSVDLILNRTAELMKSMSIDDLAALHVQAEKMGIPSEDLFDDLSGVTDDVSDENPFKGLIESVRATKSVSDIAIEAIPKNKYPSNFSVKFVSDSKIPHEKSSVLVSKSMQMTKTAKLAAVWDAIIRKLLSCEQYRYVIGVDQQYDGTFKYGGCTVNTGFVYGSPEGLMMTRKEKADEAESISIMINPEYVFSKNMVVADLLDVAHHELTHIITGHGEYFSEAEMKLRRAARHYIGDAKLEAVATEANRAWRVSHQPKTVSKTRHSQPEYNY